MKKTSSSFGSSARTNQKLGAPMARREPTSIATSKLDVSSPTRKPAVSPATRKTPMGRKAAPVPGSAKTLGQGAQSLVSKSASASAATATPALPVASRKRGADSSDGDGSANASAQRTTTAIAKSAAARSSAIQ